jgi:hypothetical protein
VELPSHLYLTIDVEALGPPTLPPSSAGGRKTGIGSFPNEVSLKLRQCPEDMEDQSAATGCGVDLLRQTLEPDPATIELGHQLNQ